MNTPTESGQPTLGEQYPGVEAALAAMYQALTTLCDTEPEPSSGWDEARILLGALVAEGYVVIEDQPDHFVTFDESGWFVEHSIACRVAGTIGTCAYNSAIRHVADDKDPHDPGDLGRWRITEIDSEGLPSLERADG